jgi:hypothetical protein
MQDEFNVLLEFEGARYRRKVISVEADINAQ